MSAAGPTGAPRLRPVRLGDFVLERPIGQGGMGAVWQGRHVRFGQPVAVKVMAVRRALSPRYRTAFRREVRAVAGLAHPGIVHVYDFGEIPDEVATSTGGALVSGSPYLVMELVRGGTLSRLAGDVGWERLCDILLELLDALAHAHSRGVIHRDLKPGNVLVGSGGSTKLTDFGLAHLSGDDPGAAEAWTVEGTPAFMAPEQFEPRRRDVGPWTDLYALGCLAYKLVTGEAPFARSTTPEALREAHLYHRPPPLEPAHGLPAAFPEWLERLLAKEVRARFQHAADAALALRRLDAAAHPGGRAASAGESAARRQAGGPPEAAELELETAAALDSLSDLDAVVAVRAARPTPTCDRVPALPAHWTAEQPVPSDLEAVAVGLGLFGLRATPLVGRDAQQTLLWETLRGVGDEGSARAVLVTGGAGVGKTRLVRWLARRAYELGCAEVMEAVHGRGHAPGQPLGSMLARFLGASGLTAGEIGERLELDIQHRGGQPAPGTVRVLADLAAHHRPSGGASGEAARAAPLHTEEAAVHAALAWLLTLVSAERPVIVVLDDVHWSAEALELTRAILERQSHAPARILLLLTARDDRLGAADVEVRACLDAVGRVPGWMTLPLAPVPQDAWRDLVRGMLRLEDGLAVQVEERTAGNPLFAVELLGDWVHRGLLEPGQGGFRLVAGAVPDLPDSVHAAWTQRVERLLADRPPADRIALELAATLGVHVARQEWLAACAHFGVEPPDGLLEPLLDQHVLEDHEAGFAFAHPMVRESLERLGAEAGRTVRLHRSCAAALRGCAAREVDERLAAHSVAAGDLAEAAEHLLRAAHQRLFRGDTRMVEPLVAHREAILERMGTPPSDPTWGPGWSLRGWLNVLTGLPEETARWGQRLLAAAETWGWPLELRAAGARWLGMSHMARTNNDEALTWLARAERDALAATPSPEAQSTAAHARLRMGDVYRRQARYGDAEACYRRAGKAFRALGDRLGVAGSLRSLAFTAQAQGDWERGERWLSRALALYAEDGSPFNLAQCTNALGEVARQRGRPEVAEAHFREFARGMEAVGSWHNVAIADVNLGLALLDQARLDEAQGHFERALHQFERAGHWRGQAWTLLCAAACRALAGDWDAFDGLFERAVAALEDGTVLDAVLADCAQRAGDAARAAGHRERAQAAYGLALAQWQGLGRPAEAQAVAERLTELMRRPPA